MIDKVAIDPDDFFRTREEAEEALEKIKRVLKGDD